MDGYKDLDLVVSDLWSQGITLGAANPEQLKTNVAFLLHEMLVRVPDYPDQQARSQEFYDACWGIVDCAQQDERI
jgi:hypothetical protein